MLLDGNTVSQLGHGFAMLHAWGKDLRCFMLGERVKVSASRAGLDARAANIVMRVVRNVADTGRTIVCTIHQPAIDIFEVL